MKNRFAFATVTALITMTAFCIAASAAVPQQPPQVDTPPTIAQSGDGQTQYLAVQVLPTPRNSTIPAGHRNCTADAECALVLTSCNSCCTTPSDMDAVNQSHFKEDSNPNVCTPEHIRNCGVPECGLFQPLPTSVAGCHEGHCAVEVHPAEPRNAPPAPAPAPVTK